MASFWGRRVLLTAVAASLAALLVSATPLAAQDISINLGQGAANGGLNGLNNGYVYDQDECFAGNSAGSYPAYPKEDDRFRVVLGMPGWDARGNGCVGETSDYPWRWGLNADLKPGQQQAIAFATERIMAGWADCIVAGGTETMSMVPMGGHKIAPNPWIVDHYPDAYLSMGLTAERLAKRYGITRQMADEFSYHSHQKAMAAISSDGAECFRTYPEAPASKALAA